MKNLIIRYYHTKMCVRQTWLIVRLTVFTLASFLFLPLALITGCPAYKARVNAVMDEYGLEALKISKDFIDELHRRKLITDADWNRLFAELCARQ